MRKVPSSSIPALAAGLVLLISLGALGWHVLVERPRLLSKGAPPAPASEPPRWRLSPLSPGPAWASLDRFAGTMTEADFRDAMQRIYGDGSDAWERLLSFSQQNGAPAGGLLLSTASAQPLRSQREISLGNAARPPRYWREAAGMPPAADPAKPLEGVKIAIDPGHIGGAWAKMEQRWYQMPGEPTAVMEGEMTLATAQLLKTSLEALGAAVSLVRDKTEPLTATRPQDYAAVTTSPQQAELFFYRKAEIRARADRVNQQLQPDLLVCLHYNAEPWGDPAKPELVEVNHLHLIVNGHYSPEEMELDDVRYEMLERVFQRSEREELRLADAVARSLASATGLPPYDYGHGHMAGNAHRPLPENPYVWARNLMANRLYQCPVIFTEPYVMNSREIYERVAAGDYEGEKLVAGKMRKSLFREYADAVTEGIKAHFAAHRPVK